MEITKELRELFDMLIEKGIDPFESTKGWDAWFTTEEALAFCEHLKQRKHESRTVNTHY